MCCLVSALCEKSFCKYTPLMQCFERNLEVIYEQRERVFHRDIQTRENNV